MLEGYCENSASQLLAVGDWSIEKEVISIHWKERVAPYDWIGPPLAIAPSAVKYRLYNRTRGTSSAWVVLVPENEKPVSSKRYPLRITEYVDWPTFRDKLAAHGLNAKENVRAKP